MAPRFRAPHRALVLLLVFAAVLCALAAGAAVARADDAPDHITGTVSKGDGGPLDVRCTVTAYNVYEGGLYHAAVSGDGTYSIGPVAPGWYQVRFEPVAPYESEWWNDWHGDRWGAPWLYMYPGGIISGIDARLTRQPSLSGTVRDPSGEPVAGAGVAAYQDQDGWSHVGDATTDAAGRYTLYTAQPGLTKVRFRSTGGLASEWWNDKDTLADADLVDVVAQTDAPGIDATLAAASSVTGTVTDRAGQPVAGLSVAAWQEDVYGWRYVSDASTDATGNYRIDGLRRGIARIQFFGSDSLLAEWYDDKASLDAADDVRIPEASEVGGVNAVLAAASSVSGAVTTPSGGPATGVRVQAWQDDGGRWVHVRDVSADALGRYQVGGLRPGNVRLHFIGPDIVGEWWQDKTSLSTADDVPLPEETEVTGVDAVVEAYGRLSGHVTDEDGDPLRAEVILYRWNGMWMQYVRWANTDWNGSYSFRGLPPGSYAIDFYRWGYLEEWYDDAWPQYAATIVPVGSGQQVTGIDASLSLGSTMSGTVRAPDGTPLSGVTVHASRYEAGYDWWDPEPTVRTGADGTYSLDKLRDGTYLVQFDRKGDYFGEWYDNSRTRERATDITVPKDGTVDGIDAVLEAGGRITGAVSSVSHKPLEGIQVTAYQQDGHRAWQQVGKATTDASGAYLVAALPEGACRVRFSDPAQQYLDGYWKAQAAFASADPVSVRWGETTARVDAVLTRSSHITGTVRRTEGSGVSSAQVAAYADDGDGGWTYLARVTADANGVYDLPGLAAGAYRVRFADPTKVLAPQWWQGAADISAARTLRLGRQATASGIDAVLRPAGSISGTVTEAGGAALRNVAVVAYGRAADGGWSYVDRVSTDALGHFAIKGVGTGKYRLKAVDVWPYWWNDADRGEFLDQWYDRAYALTAATDVPVTAGADTNGIDIGLERAGHIAGTVTNASGDGVGDATVEVQRYDGRRWRYYNYDMTRADGAYDVGQLPAGQYRVLFMAPWRSGYASEYYDGSYTANGARLVGVTAGQTTPGIDAVLEASSRLQGRVTGPDGSPRRGISVYLVRYDDDGDWQYFQDSSTDASGAWTLDDVTPGTVRVQFSDGSGECASEFWDDQVAPQDATPIEVTAGQVVDGLDAQLSPAGSINGRVTGPDGRAVEHSLVHLWVLGPAGWHNAMPGDYGFTDHFGRFRFDRLHEGTYRISVDGRGQGYAPLFYPASPDLAGAWDVAVEPGEKVADIDLQLGVGESIAGHVTDAGGRGAAVSVAAYRADGADWEAVADVSSDATGAYTLTDLAPGTYRVRFGDEASWSIGWFFTQWARDAATLADADDVVVHAGDGTVVVDATLLHKAQPVSLSSATHPDQTAWYRGRDLVVGWTPADPSVVDGYAWLLDRSAGTVVPKSVNGNQTSAGFKGLADGTWYFHVRGLGVQEAQHGVLKSSWSPTVAYVVHVDTVAPTTAAPTSQTVTRGNTTTLDYRVNDAAPNGGTAKVRIEIRDGKGKLATTLDLGTQSVNRLLGARFRCTLATGTYTFSVYATDTAGNPQSVVGSNKLKVR